MNITQLYIESDMNFRIANKLIDICGLLPRDPREGVLWDIYAACLNNVSTHDSHKMPISAYGV